MKYNEFFETFGKCRVGTAFGDVAKDTASIEDLYQAIKDRLIEETDTADERIEKIKTEMLELIANNHDINESTYSIISKIMKWINVKGVEEDKENESLIDMNQSKVIN
tara:strand:+ start:629 stop:952 length:324 start_codon:yes stop_codon:yes gene_type:complete